MVVGRAADATISTLYGRHRSERLRFTSLTDTGKVAITHVQVIEALGQATLVSCRLETGRTHQIRVHLAERGSTPILGDPLYGRMPQDPTLRAAAAALGRQALLARCLATLRARAARSST
jgi:23S rRNA pseudouridine1911/1915/1917 synthase